MSLGGRALLTHGAAECHGARFVHGAGGRGRPFPQIYRVARALSDAGARLRVAAMTGGQSTEAQRAKSLRTQREMLAGLGVDLLVATPGMVKAHLESGHLELSLCRGLVLDEVDVLLGGWLRASAEDPHRLRRRGSRGALTWWWVAGAPCAGDAAAFEAQIAPLREAAPPSLRFLLVTATLPQHTADSLRGAFKDLALASGPGLHRTAAGAGSRELLLIRPHFEA